MSLTIGLQQYTFGGITFSRGDFDFGGELWPELEAIATIEPILNSSNQYRDSGGTKPGPFEVRAVFNSFSDQNSMRTKVGVVGSLTKATTNQSATMMLRSCKPIIFHGNLPGADLRFE